MTNINAKDRANDLTGDLTDYGKDFLADLYDGSDYVSDRVFDFADGAVDIYNADLEMWVHADADACHYMGEVIDEGLVDTKNYDFHRHIMVAQFEQIEQQVSGDMENILHAWAYELAADESDTLTEEQADAIDDIDYTGVDRLDEVSDEVARIMTDTDEED